MHAFGSSTHRVGRALLVDTVLLVASLSAVGKAQGGFPWERAAANLEFTFTGPLARSLALVAIVIGGLMFMFGGGLALFAAQFLAWLF
jgi:type IV secretory pathway VirB2 component (pilin)